MDSINMKKRQKKKRKNPYAPPQIESTVIECATLFLMGSFGGGHGSAGSGGDLGLDIPIGSGHNGVGSGGSF